MKLLTTDNKTIDVHPRRPAWGFTLNELRTLIDGKITIIPLDSGDYLIFDCESVGETNKFASQLAKNIGHWESLICGSALLANQSEIET